MGNSHEVKGPLDHETMKEFLGPKAKEKQNEQQIQEEPQHGIEGRLLTQ